MDVLRMAVFVGLTICCPAIQHVGATEETTTVANPSSSPDISVPKGNQDVMLHKMRKDLNSVPLSIKSESAQDILIGFTTVSHAVISSVVQGFLLRLIGERTLSKMYFSLSAPVLTLVLSVLSRHAVRGQTQLDSLGKAGFPLILTGIPLDPCKMYGTWYEYKHLTVGITDANAFSTYLPIGIASTTPLTVAMHWTTQAFVPAAQAGTTTPACFSTFQQANFTADGKKISSVWRQGSTTPVRAVLTILYTDYDNVEVSVVCTARDPNRPTFCLTPSIFVLTRLRPPSLPATTQTLVQNAVNQALQPYGYAFSDLSSTLWNSTLAFPPCNPAPTAPAQFVQQVNVLKTALANNGGCYRFNTLPTSG
ncbi:hypothetical protein RvY_10957 [Ramazzottius varieornatus]|uniref:Lipocalin/cytosolic fatty-acid binding domain-containing protein n=1 Tax=Ramazzottius varieornatus TaxID=947166 RepID=A0A1D1VNG0_RAMVA|nr:hypothetical protein RvY_10957 [Ramazzottius varieornatus]